MRDKVLQGLCRNVRIGDDDLRIVQQGQVGCEIGGGDALADIHVGKAKRHIAVDVVQEKVGGRRAAGHLQRVADVDAELAAGGRNAMCMQVVAEGGQQADIHAEQAHVVGNISSDAAETDAHAAGVGIPRDERRVGLAADIDVHAADDGGIGAGAEHIALPGDVALFHQVGDMDCDRGAGDARAFRKGFLRDHGVGLDPLQDLPFTLCHGHAS